MRYPRRVTGTIKGGVDVTLGMRTVLVGSNGAGKSAVVQAIELASRGYVTDTEGRDKVSQAQMLARLFPSGKDRKVRVEWSDGSEFSWELPNGGKEGTFKTPISKQPFVVSFPVDSLASTLSRDDASVRSWMEAQVFGEVGLEDVLSAVRGHDEVVRTLYTVVGKADFLGLAAEARSQARSLRLRATRTESTIEQLTQGLSAPLTSSEKRRLEEKIAELERYEGGMTKSEYDAEKAELDGLSLQLAAMPKSEASSHVRGLMTIQELINTHIRHFGSDLCLVCGNSKVNIKGQQEQVKTLLEAAKGLVMAEQEREKVRVRIEQGLSTLQKAVLVPDGFREQKRELEKTLYADAEARKAWDNAQAARAEVDGLRTLANEYEQVSKLLDNYGRVFLKDRKSAFEEKVNPFLANAEFCLDFDASRVGLKKGDDIYTALSGVEEARVFLALGAAMASRDAIMIPKDRAWDAKTLTATMEALSRSDVPVLIMSTVAPVRPVEGWTIVEVSRWEP